ncbi:MAG TPA: helix-turn-helix domain-containing protein [Candidatus Paceibacterota bacterium]
MSDEETTQPSPEPTTSPENPISEPNPVPVSPQELTVEAPIQPTESTSVEVLPVAPETPANPESAVPVTNDIPANEPLGPAPVAEIPNEPLNHTPEPEITANPINPNITIEKHGNDVTITEVMQPTAHSEPATAQMAGNEPLDLVEEEKAKKREENLKLANQNRQDKKRKKIDAILDLFAKQTNLTNDEVEKLLHVSDATATRYLETLEKEGKIKQVGKTGKGVMYEKI